MEQKEILKFCLEKGCLIDKEILNVFQELEDPESIKLIIEKVKNITSNKIINKEIFVQNSKLNDFLSNIPPKNKSTIEKLKIKLGLNIEISKEVFQEEKNDVLENESNLKIVSNFKNSNNKLEVKDFVIYFRNRFSLIRNILQERGELTNLVSINKISKTRQTFSVIGIISSKKVTKNKNILLEIEDLTGKIRILVSPNDEKLYKEAEDIVLDSVLGFKVFGNNEISFVKEIVFPDSILSERKKSFQDEAAIFLGDLHYGSKKFLLENFEKFIDYLNGKNSENDEYLKIKYLFIVGDLITGVGNYPGQDNDLEILSLEEQFQGIANLLGKIRKDIKIIISPGNHDGVRIMEPQPLLDQKYAWPLYNLENVYITFNPVLVNIGFTNNFSGFNVLCYHGFSFPYYANNVPKLMVEKTMNSPEKIMKYLLKNRHLAPTHASVQYFPLEKDVHFIEEIPDIFVAGHTHKSAVLYYNNILIISSSSWEEKTPYQEKFGNEPDHCKVPMFNLKTRQIKILDFE